MFFLLLLHFHSCSYFFPVPLFQSINQSINQCVLSVMVYLIFHLVVNGRLCSVTVALPGHLLYCVAQYDMSQRMTNCDQRRLRSACASVQSDQSLRRSHVPSTFYSKMDKRESLSYWVDVQADMSLYWLHRSCFSSIVVVYQETS